MTRRIVLLAFALSAAALAADLVIGTVSVSPTFAPPNTPAQITITAVISDPGLAPGGANVQRLNSAGSPSAVLGILHDDGLNGDAIAGDGTFTLVFTLNEPAAGRVLIRASGSFKGVSARVASSSVAVDIGSSATSLAIDASVSAAPNAAGWYKQDVAVTFACTGGAGGSETCPGTIRVSSEGAAQNISGIAKDGAGNTVTKSVALSLDKTGPVLTVSSPVNAATFNVPAVTVTGTVTDALSGVASFTCNNHTAVLTGSAFSCNLPLVPGANTINVQAADVAGNTASSSLTVNYSVSTLTISALATPPPNAAGWNNADVTLAYTCGGGVAPLNCPQTVVISNESATQVIGRTVTDAAGSTTTSSVTLKIDKTRPALVITSPASAASTVTQSQITVTGSAPDALSGLARVICNGVTATLSGTSFSCPLTLASGLNTINVQAVDIAGNIASTSLSVTLGTALTISATPSPAPNVAGWNNGNVTVSFTCAGGVTPVTCPAPVTVTTEGAAQVVSKTATDGGGNTASASVTLKIDKTNPVVTVSSPASNATVNASQVTITGIISDALSGIASGTCNGAPVTLTQSNFSCIVALQPGLNTVIVRAVDVAGNATAVSLPVSYSTPQLTISATPTPAANTAGWNNSDVTVSFTCAGGTSPITCPPPVTVSTEGANQTVSRTATDSGGNTAAASVTLKIDKTNPDVAITSPVSGATVTAAQLTVTGTAADATSGVAAVKCNTVAAILSAGNWTCTITLAAGPNTITVLATDVAGNSVTSSIPVTYTSGGGLSVSATVTPTSNAAGWNNSDATVTFKCTGGTGTVTCPAPVLVSTEGANQVIARTATDGANNSASASVTLKIDKTAPSLAVTTPASGAVITTPQAAITGTATDGLSGLSTVTCNGAAATITSGTFACSFTLALGTNGVSVSATDIAGNVTTSTLSLTYQSSLTVTFTAPANLSYLNLSPTTVSGTVSDSTATVTINGISAPVASGHFTAQIPLAEGPNILTATATLASGPAATASIQLTLDTTPPHVTITSPADKFVTTDAVISLAGNVNDIVVGTVNSQQAQVSINGAAAQVANRTFLATNIPLAMGSNTIQAVAVDRAGNSATTQITITRQAPQPGQITLVSGNNQPGTIGTALAASLVIGLTDATGNPAPNKPVIFSVTQNNGILSVNGGTPAASVMATTDAQGRASAAWTLGMRSGAGSDSVQAYSVGSGGTAVFTASASQGTPGLIVIDSGNNQTGAINQPLPKPLIAVVIDKGHNRLAGVPVTFTVQQGGGSFGGQATFTTNTDSDGRAAATPTLGFQEGNSNNLITADFVGDTGFPASFASSGRAPADPSKTVISGIVLDNSNQPIPGVTVRAVLTNSLNSSSSSAQVAATIQTDSKGAFTINKAPVGFVKLMVDGSTATAAGAFPTLDYDMVTVAGQSNTVGQPIYLLPIKTNNQLCVTPTTGGGTLAVPDAPGFSLTFAPGQVTFPGGSKTGCVSVTVVHPDKVPMTPGFGQQPRFIVTIQPSGALFSPPAPMTLPNVDGLVPREVTEMYSFDHDIGSFVAIGTGTVSDDGQVIRSNPGVGVLKAGWHCGGDPQSLGWAFCIDTGPQCQASSGSSRSNSSSAQTSDSCTCPPKCAPGGSSIGEGAVCRGEAHGAYCDAKFGSPCVAKCGEICDIESQGFGACVDLCTVAKAACLLDGGNKCPFSFCLQ